jgi:hypothetical protein
MGYDVNYRSDNMKLLLMFLACVAAMIAQFFPVPFPENRMILGICCGSYFLMSCVLQYIVTFVDQDTIAITNSFKVSDHIYCDVQPCPHISSHSFNVGKC